MIDGFDHDATLHRPSAPSLKLFLTAGVAIVAVMLAVAAWVTVERRSMATARDGGMTTASRRILLARTAARIAETDSAARHYRLSGDPATRVRYEGLRIQAERTLAQLVDSDVQRADRGIDTTRLRRLAVDQLAADDAILRQVDASPGSRTLHDAGAGDARTAAAIAAEAAALDRDEARRQREDVALSERRFGTLGQIIALITIVSVLAVILALWLTWRSRCRHYLLEVRAFDAMARLRAILAGTSDAIVIIDLVGRIEEINPAASRMLGHGSEDVEGRDISAIVDMPDGDMPLARRAGFGDGRIELPMRMERTARHRDGTAIPVDIALGLMPSGDGARLVASFRDVSERKAAERTKDDFISTISHELRTPLTSVVGALGLLREGAAGALPDAAARLIDIAENNARRLIRLVNDILDIDRLGSGRITLAVEPLDLREIATRARTDAEGIAAPRGVRLVLDLPATAVTVAGDAERLLQVIGNLLSNAVRFSPAGGTVTLSVELRGADALIRVADEGPGVPEEFRDRLFGRFTQSSAGAAIPGGTGLGLAISREIVRAHQGDIWYAEGRGARFCVSLPLVAAEPLDNRRRLLLCEDDPLVAALLRDMIEDEGYLVDRCGSVAEACAMARTGRYDALLLDLTLPDADGLDAVRAIRRQPETIALPVIVISGAASHRSIDPDATGLGVVDWIDKPIDHARLLKALDAAIRAADSNRPVLLHVEDDPDVREVVALALADRGRILQASSLASARAALAACTPAAAILDLDLPDGSGLQLLPLLAGGPHGRIPTVIYTASADLPPVGGAIEVVLVKSVRSPLVLSETIGAVLARQPVVGEDDR